MNNYKSSTQPNPSSRRVKVASRNREDGHRRRRRVSETSKEVPTTEVTVNDMKRVIQSKPAVRERRHTAPKRIYNIDNSNTTSMEKILPTKKHRHKRLKKSKMILDGVDHEHSSSYSSSDVDQRDERTSHSSQSHGSKRSHHSNSDRSTASNDFYSAPGPSHGIKSELEEKMKKKKQLVKLSTVSRQKHPSIGTHKRIDYNDKEMKKSTSKYKFFTYHINIQHE